jgi:hypothetical protein
MRAGRRSRPAAREGLHVDRRDDPRLEAKPPEGPADELRAEAGLHAHDAPRQLLEHLRQGEAPDLQAQHAFAGAVEADEMEGVLADVDADHGEVGEAFMSSHGHPASPECEFA